MDSFLCMGSRLLSLGGGKHTEQKLKQEQFIADIKTILELGGIRIGCH